MKKSKTAFMVPLLGMIVGAGAARAILRLSSIAALLGRAEALPLGGVLSSVDNITLAGGLIGLVLAAVVAARVMAKKPAGPSAAVEGTHEKT